MHSKELYHKVWENNSLKVVEALIILDIMNFIKKNILGMIFGEIIVINDHWTVHKNLTLK